MRAWLTYFCLTLIFVQGYGQKKKKQQSSADDYVTENSLRYEDWVYKDFIRTVRLHEVSFDLSPPILDFDSNQQLELNFDDLEGGYKNYYYTLIHCDANWKPSDLMVQEYLTGFYEDQITNYDFSSNTLQKYTHYKLVFPNQSMRFSKTGNYVIMVYQDQNKENLILSRRFMVFSRKVTISGRVHQAAGSDEYMNKQEVDFSIFYPGYPIQNPYNDIKVVIQQNARWDNAIYGIQPQFLKAGEMTYDYDDGTNVFNGGNEFRNFDAKSFRWQSQFVSENYKDSLLQNHVVLYPEEVKTFKRYYQTPDINGRFLVKVEERRNSDTEADYAWVHFFLPWDTPMSDGNFYVLGGLSDHHLNKTNRMNYNYRRKGYELEMYLKQGYYNYIYVFQQDGKTSGDETLVEGNHWETENDYSIYVYHRAQGTYYDQLIGIARMNSIRK